MSNFKIDGLDDLQNQLRELEGNVASLSGQNEIPLTDLLTDSFMRKNTSFSTFGELLAAGGFHAETSDEFEQIPDAELDAHIAATTNFKSWEGMINSALEQYLDKRLGF